jgi:general nucleoside transport system permease protein
MMLRFEPRARPTLAVSLGATAAAVTAALALAAIPLAAAGAPVGTAFAAMAAGAAGSAFALSETLTRATPLIFTGLAAAVAFRARLFNIGAEGQLYAGALAAVAVGSGAVDAPAILLVPLILLAAAAAGSLLMLVPTLLKTRLGVDEVVTTLLLNFVVLLFVQMMLEGPLKDPMGGGWPQSAPILDEGVLPPLVERLRVHAGLILALALALGAQVLISLTVLGLKIRAVGENAAAARHAGIGVTRVAVTVGLMSGALAGLAGASEVAGLKGYLTADLSRGFGYAGIVVAMLAGLNPLGVIPAALLIAGVFVGADTMSRAVGVSNYIADLIVALALLCILVSGLVVRFRVRWG